MTSGIAIASLITLAVGGIFCFAGYRLFRIIIAVWGFFIGFLIGAQVLSSLFGNTFLATPLAWVVGIVLGIILACLSYALYTAAIAILGASVGYLIGVGLMTALGFDNQTTLTFLAGVLVGALFGLLILFLHLAKLLIILNTALGGASAIILGLLLFLKLVPLSFLDTGLVGALIKGSPVWGIAWLVVAALGIIVQYQSTRHYEVEKYAPSPRTREVVQ